MSPTHIYPGPVGVDIKCSMSLLQLDLPADQSADKRLRRALINAITERTPTGLGKGQRSAKKARPVEPDLGRRVAIEGRIARVCQSLGIPPEWATPCEDAFHVGHKGLSHELGERLDFLICGQSSLRNSTLPNFSHVKTIRSRLTIVSFPGMKRGLRNSVSAIWPSPRPVRMFARHVMAPPGT